MRVMAFSICFSLSRVELAEAAQSARDHLGIAERVEGLQPLELNVTGLQESARGSRQIPPTFRSGRVFQISALKNHHYCPPVEMPRKAGAFDKSDSRRDQVLDI